MRSGQDFIRSPKLSPADAIELAIFFASTPITHFLTVLSPQILAVAEGFEPPSSVLETDSLTVELTPLKLLSHLVIVPLNLGLQLPNHPIAQPPNLLHFFVRRVLTATAAELLELQPLSHRFAVLRLRVVPLFA